MRRKSLTTPNAPRAHARARSSAYARSYKSGVTDSCHAEGTAKEELSMQFRLLCDAIHDDGDDEDDENVIVDAVFGRELPFACALLRGTLDIHM